MGVVSDDNIRTRFGYLFCIVTLVVRNDIGIFNSPVKCNDADIGNFLCRFYIGYDTVNIVCIADDKL